MADRLVHTYTPRGTARRLFQTKDSEILLSGPAGTGKSRACLEKLHLMAVVNPGMRGLIVRKTASSLTSSALVTWNRDVTSESQQAGVLDFYGGSAEEPAQYRYSNGSKVMIGGMDKASKIMSTEFDVVYVQEATELTENDWESLTTRLRSHQVSFQQLIADCNPAEETHWLKRRCDRGLTLMLRSRHEDNPLLFDEAGQATPRGLDYLSKLDRLTGIRKRRLRDGEWSSAEGVIYEDWDSAIHLVDRFPIPDGWQRWWAVDFGYTNPFVLQCWAEDEDGRLWLYREWYHTQRTVDDHARRVLDVVAPDGKWTEPKPRAVICDHDAEGQEVLRRELGLPMRNADKRVQDGIQTVMRRLKPAGDGRPRLYLLRDSLVERDPELYESGRPTCTADEIPSYVWANQTGHGKGLKEVPVKEDDHGCLIAGTLVTTSRGAVPIEQVGAGDWVRVRGAWRLVEDAGMTDPAAVVYRAVMEDGRELVGTGDHPVWVHATGWTRLDALRYGMMVSCLEPSDTTGMPTAGKQTAPTTSGQHPTAPSTFTGASTKTSTGRSPTDTQSTTSTLTRPTTSRTISWRSLKQSIRRFTSNTGGPTASTVLGRPFKRWKQQPNGTDPRRVENGIANTAAPYGIADSRAPLFVTNVASNTTPGPSMVRNDSAPTTASQGGGESPASTTSPGSANAAEPDSLSTVTRRPASVVVRVLSVTRLDGRVPVFNLTVADPERPEFYANGLLVHNCDAARYMAMAREEAKPRVLMGAELSGLRLGVR